MITYLNVICIWVNQICSILVYKQQLTDSIFLISCTVFVSFEISRFFCKFSNIYFSERTMKTGNNCNFKNVYPCIKIEPDNPKFLWNDYRYRRKQGENGPWTRCIRPRSYVNYSLGVLGVYLPETATTKRRCA